MGDRGLLHVAKRFVNGCREHVRTILGQNGVRPVEADEGHSHGPMLRVARRLGEVGPQLRW